MTALIWRRGSTFRMSLSVTSGEVVGDEEVRCSLKVNVGGIPIGAELMEFAVSFAAEDGSTPAMWIFEGTAEQSLSLPIATLIADARVVLADEIVISETVAIQHIRTVTPE